MARLPGSINNDTITGYNNSDQLSGNYGDDQLSGGNGNDRLDGGRGNDVLDGGDGNDLLLSRSDAGEPTIAQSVNANNDPNGEVDPETGLVLPQQVGLPADDILTGGAGADTFRFETLIAAKQSILEKHANSNTGVIDYSMMGVAGENNLVHDHWVDSIGNDTITDFNAAEGDRIQIRGHTTEVSAIDIVDADGDGQVDDTVLQLRSNQGANGGAHNLDLLGTITVLNNQLDRDDFSVNAGVNYGIVRNISQVGEAIDPLNPGAPAPAPDLDPVVDPVVDPDPGAGAGGDPATGDAGGDPATGDAGGDPATGDAGGDPATGDAGGDPATGDAGGDPATGDAGGDPVVDPVVDPVIDPVMDPVVDPVPAAMLADLLTPPADAVAGQPPTAGDDVLIYGDGDDSGTGGLGNDLLIGLAGDDALNGSWGDDRIDGGTGDDQIAGGHGDDLISGNDGDDFVTGNFGDDILIGGAGGDELRGNRGEDVLFGGADDDVLSGGAGDDILHGGAGEDAIDGGSGTDALLLNGAIGDYTITVGADNVQFTDANGATDIVSRVEQFRFLGSGETYQLQDGALAITADTGDLDDLLDDALINELIAGETGTAVGATAAPEAGNDADVVALDTGAPADPAAPAADPAAAPAALPVDDAAAGLPTAVDPQAQDGLMAA